MNKFQKIACSYAKTQINKGIEKDGFVAIKNRMYSHNKAMKRSYIDRIDFNKWNREECKY